MEDNYIVTVDLGSGTLRIAVARVMEGKIDLCYYNDYSAEGMSHGKILNPSRLATVLGKAKKDAEEYLGIKINDIAVGCQKNDIRSIDVNVKLELSGNGCVDKESLGMVEDLARKESEMQLKDNESILSLVPQHFDLDDECGVSVDDIIGMTGLTLEATYKVFIGKTSALRQIDEACKLAGIALHKHIFIPQYEGMCCLTGSEKESGVALFNLGSGASSVSVFYGGVLRHYGSIPFGGDSITADIRNLCSIDDVRLADNIKKGYGGCMPDKLQSLGDKTLRITDIHTGIKTEITAKYLSEVITARMKEIINALLYELQISGYADGKLKNGIVVVGGMAPTLNICNLIKEMSGFSARIGAPARNLFETTQSRFFSSDATSLAALLIMMAGQGVNCAEVYTAPQTPEPANEPEPAADPSTHADKPQDNGNNLFGGLFGDDEIKVEPKPKKKSNKTVSLWKSLFSSDEDSPAKDNAEAAPESKSEKTEKESSFSGKMDSLFDKLLGSDNDPENQA